MIAPLLRPDAQSRLLWKRNERKENKPVYFIRFERKKKMERLERERDHHRRKERCEKYPKKIERRLQQPPQQTSNLNENASVPVRVRDVVDKVNSGCTDMNELHTALYICIHRLAVCDFTVSALSISLAVRPGKLKIKRKNFVRTYNSRNGRRPL